MIYKNRVLKEYKEENYTIFCDEELNMLRLYDSGINLDYVYTVNKKLYLMNNHSTFSMYEDDDQIGYFVAKISTLNSEEFNFKTYDRYYELLEFGINLNDKPLAKMLVNYLLYSAKMEGTKFVKISKQYDEFETFYDLLINEYHASYLNNAYYIEIENPIIYSDLQHLRKYEGDLINLDVLHYLYYIGYEINQDNCTMRFYNGDVLTINRKNLTISYPDSIVNNSNVLTTFEEKILILLYFINMNYREIIRSKLELGYKINENYYIKMNDKLIASENIEIKELSKFDKDDVTLKQYLHTALNINEVILFGKTQQEDYTFYYKKVILNK